MMNAMKASVSCLIPAYNEGANIGRVLDVVQELSFLDEIIVLDDGSSDNTAEVVQRYQKKSGVLKLLTSPANRGKTATIQKGVESCRGDVVVILDSDLINLKPVTFVLIPVACLVYGWLTFLKLNCSKSV
jgi:glycosyltransferase involved in cell wall biosynthesis